MIDMMPQAHVLSVAFLQERIYMGKVKIVGVEKLQKKLRKNVDMDEVKHMVRKHGSQLEANAKRKAEFKGHYEWSKEKGGEVFVKPSGNLKNSIRTEIRNGGMTAEVEPTAEYAAYVELGTRHMEAQPYLKPAFEEQKEKFKKDMQKFIK